MLEIAEYLQKQASSDWTPITLEEEDNVYVLKTEAIYDEFIENHELVVLFIYAPWLVKEA